MVAQWTTIQINFGCPTQNLVALALGHWLKSYPAENSQRIKIEIPQQYYIFHALTTQNSSNYRKYSVQKE